MINQSPQQVMAYWFFTPRTIPDRDLLDLLSPDRHEVALHVATKPYQEWEKLEEKTGRKIKYYTVHGTARLIARLMWRRKLWEAKAPIPAGFPLKSFYDFDTIHLDRVCYDNPKDQAVRIAQESIAKGKVLHVHPEWLFQRGTLNHRGPYYETLKTLLHVDNELALLASHKKFFFRIAKYPEQYEYLHDYAPSKQFLEKLAERGVDLFTFVERKWCCPVAKPPENWLKAEDNIALIEIVPFEEWRRKIGKKTRNMIRKAEKNNVKTDLIQPSDDLANGVWKIYNETPIRQGRAFSHYGLTLENVKNLVHKSQDSTFVGAFLDEELVGFIQLVHGDNLTVMAQILSLQKFWDKAVNNALVAKAMEVCASKKVSWLMYGRIGNHPSLDNFKESNGFSKCTLTRFYVPITSKGRIAVKMGFHRSAKDVLPEPLKGPLIPLFNWLSRTKVLVKRRLTI